MQLFNTEINIYEATIDFHNEQYEQYIGINCIGIKVYTSVN